MNGFAARQLVTLSLLFCAWTARAAESQGNWVIPPQQESLVGGMLGTPPGSCRFLGVSIDQTRIRARYQCAAVPFAVELVHPSEAVSEPIRTAQFALVVPPEAPPGFGDALAEAIRAGESPFRWANTRMPAPEGNSPGGSLTERFFAWSWRTLWSSVIGRLFATSDPPQQSFRNIVFIGIAGAGLAFVIALAAALRGFGELRTATGDLSREHEGFAAMTVFAIALLYYALSSHAAPFTLDTTRDVLSAHDCLKTTHSCDILPPTSLGLFNQGGLWLRILSLWLALELPFWVLEATVICFHAFSAVCVYLLVRRYLAARLAPVATALYLVTSLYVLDYPVVFNISASLLPMAACVLSLMALISTGTMPWAVAAAVTFTLAADAHVIFLMYLPWLLFAVAATARQPRRGTARVFVAIAITGAVQSFNTWLANIHFLFSSSTALATFVGISLALAGGFCLRRRFAGLDARARCAVLLAAPTALFFVAYLGTRTVLRDAPPMYAVPAQVGLCVGVAALIDAAARAGGMGARGLGFNRARQLQNGLRIAIAVPVVSSIHLCRTDHSGPRLWSMREVETVAHVLYDRGYRFADLRAHLQTSRDGLLAGLGDFEPRTPPAVPAPQDDILLLRVPQAVLPSAVPAAWTVVDFQSGYAAVLRATHSVLDRAHMEACYRPLDGTVGLGGCLAVDIASDTARQRINTSMYTERMFLAIRDAESELHLVTMQKQHGSAVRFKVPIDAPAGAAGRLIEILPSRFPWRIEAVEGVRIRKSLPATRTTIAADGGKGAIIFAGEVPAGEERHELYLPPPVAETDENEAALHDLLMAQAF